MDIAAAGTTASQIATRVVTGREGDVKKVIATGFAIVGGQDRARSRRTINVHRVINFSRGGSHGGVTRYSGRADVHARPVINVIKMSPKFATSNAAANPKTAMVPRRRADNEPAPCKLVALPCRRWTRRAAAARNCYSGTGEANRPSHAAG